MCAQMLSQRGVHDVCGRVIARCGLSQGRVGEHSDFLSCFERAGKHVDLMHKKILGRFDGAHNVGIHTLCLQSATITCLPAGFSVAGGLITDDLTGPFIDLGDDLALANEGDDSRVSGQGVVTQKTSLVFAGQFQMQFFERGLTGTLPAGTGAFFLFVHGGIETVLVDRESVFQSNDFCEVERETKGVVEFEGHSARKEFLFILLVRADFLGEEFESFIERFQKTFFLSMNDFFNGVAMRAEFGIRGPHFFQNHTDEFIEERLCLTQQFSMTDGASEDAPQNVAPAFVGGQDTVANQKNG
ncbi:MAG: hypothetical protein ACD_62C00557G0002 [uncultured bacterium]|nr:MAG: hypothetical protein ACD_62C00557G0002 [uncultured bacterium]